jgi:hypothetical protein
MKTRIIRHRLPILAVLTMAVFVAAALLPEYLSKRAEAQQVVPVVPNIPAVPAGSAYRQTNLVSDWPGIALLQNPLIVNPWGISATASSPFWVANNGTSTSALFTGDVSGSPLVSLSAMPLITVPGGLPTGTVTNGVATEFVLPGACALAPCAARFLFASITGNIIGWNPNAPAAGSTTGVIAVSNPGHVCTGLTLANNGSGNFLYAADFANGAIDVYNTSFCIATIGKFPLRGPYHPDCSGKYVSRIQRPGDWRVDLCHLRESRHIWAPGGRRR